MALLALAVLQAAPAAADNDVVVTADRLRRLRIATRVEGGRIQACEIRVTSGDAEIDGAACEATKACFDSGVTDAERLADCVDGRVVALVRKRREG
jgi:hypothetical protein